MKRHKILQRSFSDEFVKLMENRVVASHFKYGDLTTTKKDVRIQRNEIKNAEYRMKLYLESGNTEYLVDAANFLMFEFMEMHGHFLAMDSDDKSKIV